MAPKAIVKLPRRIKNKLASCENSNKILKRIIKYIPIITKVDECIKAEAGVGASIASGSQV
jgi:hypothetical protein